MNGLHLIRFVYRHKLLTLHSGAFFPRNQGGRSSAENISSNCSLPESHSTQQSLSWVGSAGNYRHRSIQSMFVVIKVDCVSFQERSVSRGGGMTAAETSREGSLQLNNRELRTGLKRRGRQIAKVLSSLWVHTQAASSKVTITKWWWQLQRGRNNADD